MTDVASDPGDVAGPFGSHPTGSAGRIRRGFAANIAGNGVTVLGQLLTVPVLLTAWGAATYGEWLVLTAIPTYVALSDLSFSRVAGNSMVMLEAKGRQAEAVMLGRHLWSIVPSLTGLAVAGAIAIAFVLSGALGTGSSMSADEVRIVLAALFLQMAVAVQHGVLDAWFRFGGRYPLGVAVRQVTRLLELGAILGAVLLGADPGAAAVALLLASVVGFCASALVLRTAVPSTRFRPARPDRRTFRDLLGPGLAFMAFPVGSALSIQGYTILVGALLGSTAVVVWSTTRTVTRIGFQVMVSINSAIWPELSRSVGALRLAEARSILRRATQAAVVMSGAFIVLAAVIGPAFIRWWTRGNADPPPELLYILLLVVACNSVWFTLSAVLLSTNSHHRLAVIYLGGTTVAFLAAIPLTAALGLPGAAISLLAIDAGMVAYVAPAALRVVHDTGREFVRSMVDVPAAVRSLTSRVRPS